MYLRPPIPALLALLAAWPAAAMGEGSALAGGRRCLALIAYAEAAGEGDAGMAAVIRVVRNRIEDGRFASDACAVILAKGQFQPVAMSPAFAAALTDPGRDPAGALQVDTRLERQRLARAEALAQEDPALDATGGAIFFVNPHVMDPANCPWFARLKRTATIGAHVFMTHYRPDEPKAEPAIDCAEAGAGFKSWLRGWNQGVMAPGRPKVASITPTPAMLKKWQASGRLQARQRDLRRRIGLAFQGRD